MSRQHNRFERDYRCGWERRERCTLLSNSSCNTTTSSGSLNGHGPHQSSSNSRPGLLPLPVIPSLLPTPITVAVTSSSNELAGKRTGAVANTPTSKVLGVSPGEGQVPGTVPGPVLAGGVRWGQTPINQNTPWETDEPPWKQRRDNDSTGMLHNTRQ
ncbi:hypothetical protein GJAV_G00115090 [Gymnothorax javanicus]|nr:hypothetical protein GJAV_G00115090 [Gymnothorax javanicus]